MSAIKKDVTIGDCRLILGDCLEVMPLLGKVDAVVTDPPYGVLDEAWDDLNQHELAALTMAWVGQVRRMSGTATIFFGERTRQIINDILHLVYPRIRQIIWSKGGGTAASDGMFYSYESAYLCRIDSGTIEIVGPKSGEFARQLKMAREAAGISRGAVDILVRGKKTGLCYRWEEACCLPSDDQIATLSAALDLTPDFFETLNTAREERNRNVSDNHQRTLDGAARRLDLLRFPSPKGIDHPTSKPLGLMTELIEVTGGDSILDPFMGSGTTLVACAKLGRKGIGIELDSDYFDVACRRVEEAYRQPDMFVQRPKAEEPIQEPLL